MSESESSIKSEKSAGKEEVYPPIAKPRNSLTNNNKINLHEKPHVLLNEIMDRNANVVLKSHTQFSSEDEDDQMSFVEKSDLVENNLRDNSNRSQENREDERLSLNVDIEDSEINQIQKAKLTLTKNANEEEGDNEEEKEERELTGKEKFLNILKGDGKGIGLLALLYFFIVSLDLLSVGFRLIGGRTAGELFRNSDVLTNPVVGVMLGVLVTVLVQSSSTATSIIVGIVAADFVTVQMAIPIIMGCNIGTSISSTLVAIFQAGEREQFRKAFAGATILDMFNWMAFIVLLIVEIITGYLYHFSKALMDGLMPDSSTGGEVQLLSVLTKPLANLIVQIDKEVLECWSNPNCIPANYPNSLIKQKCVDENFPLRPEHKCKFLFYGTTMSDQIVGGIILFCSLIVLCTCLILIVKVLNSVLTGKLSKFVHKIINSDIPYVPWLTGYVAILIGAVMTFLVQSSSVFTSTLVPLVGLGVISIERVYPLTLGSNIGTTTTALLASMATEGKSFKPSMQIALCHLLFNFTGILLFYPIPFLRFPIRAAKFLGDTTAQYRWFAVAYIVFMFILLPGIVILLSLAGSIVVIVVASLVAFIAIFVGIVNLIQNKKPSILPTFLKTWDFLPEPLRSLAPYDRIISKFDCSKCSTCCGKKDKDSPKNEQELEGFIYPESNSYKGAK